MHTILSRIRALSKRTKITLIGLILLLLILKSCGGNGDIVQDAQTKPTVEVVLIEPGVSQRFKATGTVEAKDFANFLVESKSTVEEIYVEIGQEVQEGQELMLLSSDAVNQKLDTANAYYTTIAQNFNQTRITANQSVDEAQISLKTAQVNLEKTQREHSAKVRQAEETLNAKKLNLGLSTESANTSLDNAIRTTLTTVRTALTNIDSIVEYSPEQDGPRSVKEVHIGVKNPTQLNALAFAFIDAENELENYKETYTHSTRLLNATERVLQEAITAMHNSVTSPKYTQAQLNTDIDLLTTDLTAVRNAVSSLESAKKSFDSTVQKTGGTSQVLIDAEAAYEATMAGLEATLKRAELDVERAKNALESAIASARASEISAFTNVTTAKGELEQAKITQGKLTIIAPFDGVISDIPVRKGGDITVGQLVLSMENPTMYKITTFVSAQQVRMLQTGDAVTVNGDDSESILSVSPSADPSSKKYKVEIETDSTQYKSGEFVDLVFESGASALDDDTIYLPVTAVHITAADTYVWTITQDGEQSFATKTQVTIGELVGDSVEIPSGIADGDVVVVGGGRVLGTDGQEVHVTLR